MGQPDLPTESACMGSHLFLIFESCVVGTVVTSLALIIRIVSSEL